MHTSIFSDSFLSYRLDDSGAPMRVAASAGRAHRDGLLRGLALMAVAGLVIGLAMISGTIHSADADPVPSAGAIMTMSDEVAARHVLRLRTPDPASIDWTSRVRQ